MALLVKPFVGVAGVLGMAACGYAQPVVQFPLPTTLFADTNFGPTVPTDVMIRLIEQEYGPQIRQLRQSELHLMRLVCQPTKQQFEKIAGDGSFAPGVLPRQIADMWYRGTKRSGDPRTAVTAALAELVRTHLSPDQAARYHRELDQRAAATQQMTAMNLVARIDRVLLLTPEQRTKLATILESSWDDSWSQPQWITDIGIDWPPAWPPLPDTQIYSILTAAQTAIWRTIPERTVRFGFGMANIPEIKIPDEVWEDDLPKGKAADKDKGLPKVGGKK